MLYNHLLAGENITSSGEILEPHSVSPVERISPPTLESVDDQLSPDALSGEESQTPGSDVTDSPTPAPTTESRGRCHHYHIIIKIIKKLHVFDSLAILRTTCIAVSFNW